MKARKAPAMPLGKDKEHFQDIYSEIGVDELFDDDELTSVEEGFLKGYLAG